MNEIENGWAFDEHSGAVYHFEHFPRLRAKELAEERTSAFVVETVNWSQASGNEETVHHNKYFTFDMPCAIALAARMEIEWKDVAEEVVSIRRATAGEEQLFLRVWDYFQSLMPSAISEEQAKSL